jgi:RNA polymerase sigma-70 factor (family 1)
MATILRIKTSARIKWPQSASIISVLTSCPPSYPFHPCPIFPTFTPPEQPSPKPFPPNAARLHPIQRPNPEIQQIILPTTSTYNEPELLRLTAQGDESAFKSLFDQYWDHIYSVAFHLTKSVPLAEDLVQEIFLKIWIKRKELNGIEQFDNYLFIVARNHIYEALKKEQRESRLRQPLLDWFEQQLATPEQQLLLKESTELIGQAIARLTPQQQAIWKMTRELGMSHEQVARELNLSRNTVRNHLVNSLKTMREWLDDHASPLVLIVCLLQTLK